MAAKLQCELCGGKLTGKPGGIFECEFCGTEYSTEWAKEKIQEITGTVKVAGTVEVTGKVQVEGGTVKVDASGNVEALFKRGNMALEDENWIEANDFFEHVLNIDPENAQAYLGLCMANNKIRSLEDLKLDYAALHLEEDRSFRRAVQYAKGEFADYLQKIQQNAGRKATLQRPRMRANLEEKRRIVDKLKSLADGSMDHNRIVLHKDGGVSNDLTKNYLKDPMWEDIVAVTAFYGVHYGKAVAGLKTDGTVVSTQFQEKTKLWRNIIAISGGSQYLMGLCADGTVVSTDDDPDISEWKNIVAIETGHHKLGLRADGTVAIAGHIMHGNESVENWKNIVAISVCGQYSLGLTASGKVFAAGDGSYGRCNTEFMSDIVDISATEKVAMGLKLDGTIVTTPYTGDKSYLSEGRIDKASKWTDVACLFRGAEAGLAVNMNGKLLCTANHGDITLFDNLETIKEDRRREESRRKHEKMLQERAEMLRKEAEEEAARIAEEQRQQELARQNAEKKAALEKDRTALQSELANLKGLFTGKRRREIEARLAEIETELKGL